MRIERDRWIGRTASKALASFLLLTIACSDKSDAPNASKDAGITGAGGMAGSAGQSNSGGVAGWPDCDLPGFTIGISVTPKPFANIGEWEATGAITEVATTSFTLDECFGEVGCTAGLRTITVSAPAFELGLQSGAFVRIRYMTSVYRFGENAQLSIQNLGTWNGNANPILPHDAWKFVATEGILEHPDAPFEVTADDLPCAGAGHGNGISYELRFRATPTDVGIALKQSESASLTVGNEPWKVSVVRAFQRYGHEMPPAFAWWAAAMP